jgi:hypothetical protein
MDTKLIAIAFFVLTGLALVIILFWMIRTERRLKRFFLGKKGKDLEDTIEVLQGKISELEAARAALQNSTKDLDARVKSSIRSVEAIRFNPFPDQGGNQSFAVSMLNEEESGILLSSLYSRERMSVFAKPVKNGESEYDLTAEEKEVLWKAKEKIQKKM